VLAVSDRGEVAIRRRQDDRWLQVVPWTPTEAIRPGGETNVLTARAIGQHLTFLVNGVEVASHADTVRRHGAVGVFVGGDLTEVALERFATHVPAAVPSPRSEVRRPKSEARRF
jgi:hypothetical protein